MNDNKHQPCRQDIRHRSFVNTAHYSQGYHKPPEKPAESNERTSAQPHSAVRSRSSTPKRYHIFDFSDFKNDGDKLIILALMAILIKEGADIKLIAALVYIML